MLKTSFFVWLCVFSSLRAGDHPINGSAHSKKVSSLVVAFLGPKKVNASTARPISYVPNQNNEADHSQDDADLRSSHNFVTHAHSPSFATTAVGYANSQVQDPFDRYVCAFYLHLNQAHAALALGRDARKNEALHIARSKIRTAFCNLVNACRKDNSEQVATLHKAEDQAVLWQRNNPSALLFWSSFPFQRHTFLKYNWSNPAQPVDRVNHHASAFEKRAECFWERVNTAFSNPSLCSSELLNLIRESFKDMVWSCNRSARQLQDLHRAEGTLVKWQLEHPRSLIINHGRYEFLKVDHLRYSWVNPCAPQIKQVVACAQGTTAAKKSEEWDDDFTDSQTLAQAAQTSLLQQNYQSFEDAINHASRLLREDEIRLGTLNVGAVRNNSLQQARTAIKDCFVNFVSAYTQGASTQSNGLDAIRLLRLVEETLVDWQKKAPHALAFWGGYFDCFHCPDLAYNWSNPKNPVLKSSGSVQSLLVMPVPRSNQASDSVANDYDRRRQAEWAKRGW